MTLAEAALDIPIRVRGFRSLTADERLRLEALGVRAGVSIVKLLRTPFGDPVECLVGPQLLALDNWVLERIEVEAA